MNRRKFLAASLGATAGGILVAADVLSTKTFFLPPAGGWRSDLPILYGRPAYPISGMLYSSMIRMAVKPGQLQLHDIVAVNGRQHRIIALESLQHELGHSIELLDLVSIDGIAGG